MFVCCPCCLFVYIMCIEGGGYTIYSLLNCQSEVGPLNPIHEGKGGNNTETHSDKPHLTNILSDKKIPF